jgi:hypothetical protein
MRVETGGGVKGIKGIVPRAISTRYRAFISGQGQYIIFIGTISSTRPTCAITGIIVRTTARQYTVTGPATITAHSHIVITPATTASIVTGVTTAAWMVIVDEKSSGYPLKRDIDGDHATSAERLL